MSKFQHDVMLKIVKIIDLVMITIPFALCWELYYSYQVYAKFGWKGNWAMIGLFAVLFFLLGKVYDAFWMSLQRISELIYGQVLAAMATDGILYIVICLMSRRLCNILPGIAAIVGQVVMATLWARCAHNWYFRTFPPQPTAVVYDVRHGMEKLINEYGLSKKYDVKMTLNVEECLNDLSLLDGMQSVFISGVHSHERNIILKYCVGQGINVFVIPRVGDVIMSGAQPMHMFHLPMLRVGRYMASPEFLFVKRAMDIVISLVALVILSPVFLITAIAVKSDGGPAFYKQVRLTKDGKPFEILKFRSMRVDAEKDGVARLSTGDKDDRITKVGHIIRACRNDEPFTVNDRSTELELLYIDDLVEGMFDLLEGKEQHCEFDGVETVLKADGRYCCVPVTHKVTLGEIVDLLQEFKAQPTTLMMPKMPDGSFAKKLYSLYLTYLPTDKFKYALKMNVDSRGSFTELVHTADCGQVSINISRPGITKGQHWHNSKWELFIVVAGHGLIQERNINTGETVEFEVSGDKIEAVHMIPGWTHNIINLSETENLVTVMTCNEIFDPKHPDTFFEPV